MTIGAQRRREGRELQAAEVVAWRREQLRAAGFDRALSAALARDGRVDLHAAIGFVEQGCPPELAARILAPIDDERRACSSEGRC